MRNLTIKRKKRFVACLAKARIYLEDPTSNELLINNVPCRKIGELKNGEEKTFQIEEREAKVFVICDKLSRGFCSEYYQLPEGQEDISLSGQNNFNPAAGNAFRFDNNDNEEAVANRKRSTRRGIFVLIAAGIAGAIGGYAITSLLLFNTPASAKTFSSDGVNITLTEAFQETDVEGFTVTYGSRDVAVFIIKEPFTLLDSFEDYSLEQYADLVIQSNNLDTSQEKTNDGLITFEFNSVNPSTNENYHYFAYVFKSDDAFWLIQFSTLSENVDTYSEQIHEWAKSINFSN